MSGHGTGPRGASPRPAELCPMRTCWPGHGCPPVCGQRGHLTAWSESLGPADRVPFSRPAVLPSGTDGQAALQPLARLQEAVGPGQVHFVNWPFLMCVHGDRLSFVVCLLMRLVSLPAVSLPSGTCRRGHTGTYWSFFFVSQSFR